MVLCQLYMAVPLIHQTNPLACAPHRWIQWSSILLPEKVVVLTFYPRQLPLLSIAVHPAGTSLRLAVLTVLHWCGPTAAVLRQGGLGGGGRSHNHHLMEGVNLWLLSFCRYCCMCAWLILLSVYRFFLEVGGADSAALVWLNGCFVGAAKDSRLPSEWEVTHCIRPEGNLLAVQASGGHEYVLLCGWGGLVGRRGGGGGDKGREGKKQELVSHQKQHQICWMVG